MTEADLLNDLGAVVLKEINLQRGTNGKDWELHCNAVAGRILKRLRELGAVIEPSKYPLTYPPVSELSGQPFDGSPP